MKEEISITKDRDEYYIYEFIKSKDVEVHFVYNTTNNEFYFEQYFYDKRTFSKCNAVLEDYSTCTEEELFMQSTLYEHTKYCTIERLSAIQKSILEVISTDPSEEENNTDTFYREIEYVS